MNLMTLETSISSILKLNSDEFAELTEKQAKQRIACVVLEMVKAEVSANNSDQILAFHMQHLDVYVEQIAKVLQVGQDA